MDHLCQLCGYTTHITYNFLYDTVNNGWKLLFKYTISHELYGIECPECGEITTVFAEAVTVRQLEAEGLIDTNILKELYNPNDTAIIDY